MLKIVSFLIPLLLSLSLFAQRGGGVSVGRGGDAVVCNKKPTICSSNGENCKKIDFTGTVTQDFFVALVQASGSISKTAHLNSWKGLSFWEFREKFYSKLVAAPFYSELLKKTKNMDYNSNWYFFGFAGAAEIDDSKFPFRFDDKKCSSVQVVHANGDDYLVSQNVWDILGKNQMADQQSLMRMHEYIYAFASEKFGHKSSFGTQSLIAFLLTEEPTKEELVLKLKELNFY